MLRLLSRSAIALGLGFATAACTPPAATDGPDYYPTDLNQEGIVRGGMGSLTMAELELMQSLAWPQTYTDMKGTFGLAHRSTETADIYRVDGSDTEVWVFYSGNQATGYEVRK